MWTKIDFATSTAIVAFLATNLAVALMLDALYLIFKLPKAYRTRGVSLLSSVASAMISR